MKKKFLYALSFAGIAALVVWQSSTPSDRDNSAAKPENTPVSQSTTEQTADQLAQKVSLAVQNTDFNSLAELAKVQPKWKLEAKHIAAMKAMKEGEDVTVLIAGKEFPAKVGKVIDSEFMGYSVRGLKVEGLGGLTYSTKRGKEKLELVNMKDNIAFRGEFAAGEDVEMSVEDTREIVRYAPTAPGPEGVKDIKPVEGGRDFRTASIAANSMPTDLNLPVIYLNFLSTGSQTLIGSRWNRDFDIETINVTQDPNLAPTNAAAANNCDVIFRSVAEDYRPFNVQVTTNKAVYDTALPTNRIMVLFTSSTWYANAGGVAYLGSFGDEDAKVCWVFTTRIGSETPDWGTVASHEVGHTLGLTHDGLGDEEYHPGANSWAPIMGAGYGMKAVQWSNGDYASSSSNQDDIDLIALNFGYHTLENYRSPAMLPNVATAAQARTRGFRLDELGTTTATAEPMPAPSANVSTIINRVISTRSDKDFYQFTLGAPSTVTFDVRPFSVNQNLVNTGHYNLDATLTVYDEIGQKLRSFTNPVAPFDQFHVQFNETLPAGRYYLEVDGGNKTGSYSDYGSVGQYNVSITAPNQKYVLVKNLTGSDFYRNPAVTLVPPTSVGGVVDVRPPVLLTEAGLTYEVNVVSNMSWDLTKTAAWTSVSPTSYTHTAGDSPVTTRVRICVEPNPHPLERSMALSFNGVQHVISQATGPGLALTIALEAPTLTFTEGGDGGGWFGQSVYYKPATPADAETDAAMASLTEPGEITYMETTVFGAGTLGFDWSVSSESGFDQVYFLIDDVVVASQSGDNTTQVPSPNGCGFDLNPIWTRENFVLTPGLHRLRWEYRKDGSNSEGRDFAWLDRVSWVATPTVLFGAESRDVTRDGETFTLDVISNVTGWTIQGAPAWATVTAPATRNNNGTLTIQVAPNVMGAPARTATIRVQNAANTLFDTFVINQEAGLPPDLAMAVDTSTLGIGSGGNAPWTFQTTTSFSGGDAAQSGAIGDSQISIMSTTVIGPGFFNYVRKIDSEADKDVLIVKMNGTEIDRVSGNVDWTSREVRIESGAYVFEFIYQKDESGLGGQDAAWVDSLRMDTTVSEPSHQLDSAGGPYTLRISRAGAWTATPFSDGNWLGCWPQQGTGATDVQVFTARNLGAGDRVGRIEVNVAPGSATPVIDTHIVNQSTTPGLVIWEPDYTFGADPFNYRLRVSSTLPQWSLTYPRWLDAFVPATPVAELALSTISSPLANALPTTSNVLTRKWDFCDTSLAVHVAFPVDANGNPWNAVNFNKDTSRYSVSGATLLWNGAARTQVSPVGVPPQFQIRGSTVDGIPNAPDVLRGLATTNTVNAYLLRTTLSISETQRSVPWKLTGIVDDGAVIYLNGIEIARINMPAGVVTPATLAVATGSETVPVVIDNIDISGAANPAGTENTLSVSLHQNATNSSDIGMSLSMVPSVPGTGTDPTVTVQGAYNSYLLVEAATNEQQSTAVVNPPTRVADITVSGTGASDTHVLTQDGFGANPALPKSLATGVDTGILTFTSGGNTPWTTISRVAPVVSAVDTTYRDGVDYIRSGVMSNSQQSWVETTVVGPGVLRYFRRVSSQLAAGAVVGDVLSVTVNGVAFSGVPNVSGTSAWSEQLLRLPAGGQTVRWTYQKDASLGGGEDLAALDAISFTPAIEPYFQRVVNRTDAAGSSMTYTIALRHVGAWTASESEDWVSISPTSGTGDSTLTVTVLPNPAVEDRNAFITIAGHIHMLTQDAVEYPLLDLTAAVHDAPPPVASQSYQYSNWPNNQMNWTVQREVTHETGPARDAAASPALQPGQFSEFTTEFEGGGILSYWWKTESEGQDNGDVAFFEIYSDFDQFIPTAPVLDMDNNLLSENTSRLVVLSGDRDWRQQQLVLKGIPEDRDVSRWAVWGYEKNFNDFTFGRDKVWVDEILFTPFYLNVTPKVVTLPPWATSVNVSIDTNQDWTSSEVGSSPWLDVPANSGTTASEFEVGVATNNTGAVRTDYVLFNVGNIRNPRPTATAAYLFNEFVGVQATNSLDVNTTGQHLGGVVIAQPGPTGMARNAVRYVNTATSSSVTSLPALSLNGGNGNVELTIAFWVKRSGTQPAKASIFSNRESGVLTSIGLNAAGALTYSRGDFTDVAPITEPVPLIGPVIPNDTWTFVVVALEPTTTTFYVSDSEGNMIPQSSLAANGSFTFNSSTFLGGDPNSADLTPPDTIQGDASYYFNGYLDEVQLYSFAIAAADAQTLYDQYRLPAIPGATILSATTSTVTQINQASYLPLPAAVDNPLLTFATGGDATWVGQNYLGQLEGDAAAMPNLQDNQSAYFETPVVGPGTLKFFWKTDTDAGDALQFSLINGSGTTTPSTLSGPDTAWTEVTVVVPAGVNTLRWSYTKDSNSTTNTTSDVPYVDNIRYVADPAALGEGADNQNIGLNSTSWIGLVEVNHDGSDSVGSGNISDGQSSVMQANVTGPGSLTFWWKVNCDPGYDFLNFSVDGVKLKSITGLFGDWTQVSLYLGPGVHVLTWDYTKDAEQSYGDDRGYVDEIVWNSAANGIQVDPLVKSVTKAAQSYPITITTPGAWAITGLPAWATAVPASGTGNGTVTITVTANGSVPRATSLNIGPVVHTIMQSGNTAVQAVQVGSKFVENFDIKMLASGALQILWNNPPGSEGQRYRMHSSTDLINWDDIGNITISDPSSDYLYYTTPGVPRYFFRLVDVP